MRTALSQVRKKTYKYIQYKQSSNFLRKVRFKIEAIISNENDYSKVRNNIIIADTPM